jgi:hypothetical protein
MNAVLLAITGLSLLLAGFMSAIAWRMTQEQRRRSDARIAALAAAIYDEDPESALPRFHEPPAPAGPRYAIAALVGACVVAAIASVAVVTVRRAPHQPARVTDPQPVADTPLELLELEHERDGEQLVVRGILRNPANAAERDGLTAVVLIIGHDGELLSTTRAAIPAARLVPGATTPFVVNVAGASGVDRFRLSFRTETRVEPHVDRRAS